MDKETKTYKELPVIINFTDEFGNNQMKGQIEDNYHRIKEEAARIVADELSELISIKPGTIHTFQGSECDVII